MNKQMRDKFANSDNPLDWLVAFAWDCGEAEAYRLGYMDLFNTLVMLGVGPSLEPDLSPDMPKGYDQCVYNIINRHGLVKKLRRCLLDDIKKPDLDSVSREQYERNPGSVACCEKSYAKWLLTFLKSKKD